MDTEQEKLTIEEFTQKLLALQKEYSVTIEPEWDFPQYRELPVEAKLALMIIEKHGMEIKLICKVKKEK